VILWDLQQDGIIVKNGKKYSSITKENEYFGILRISKQGYGIVKCNDEKFEEIIIESKNLANAEMGDKVKVVLASVNEELALGIIVEILEPAAKLIKGKLIKKGKNYLIEPTKRISKKITLKKSSLFNALPGDVVEAKIVKSKTDSIQVKVTNIVAREFVGDVSYYDLYKEYALSDLFTDDIENEITKFSEEYIAQESSRRYDLRNEVIFTIDPEDAKDYDDAVSLKSTDDGNYELGVHIADVSFFVRENSALDKEAFKRGTSIYLPGKAVPMLPNKLTNQICSLVENKDRLTFSILIKITPLGDVLSSTLYKSVMNSKKRFTYHDAQQLLEECRNHPETEKSLTNPKDYNLGMTLLKMDALSKNLHQKRKTGGSIDFSSSEPFFKMDKTGKVLAIGVKESLETNQLIEEFMLLANRLVTEKINHSKPEYPFIYRIHDEPPSEKLDELRKVLKFFGYPIKKGKKITARTFQSLLEAIKNDRFKNILNDVIIRSMAKAVYSIENIGHFGLGFKFYTHFTSPIRRYPDLIVHRLLEKYILNNEEPSSNLNTLSNIALHSSETERRAMNIERDAIKIKQIEFLADKTDQIYNAVIYNIVEFGFFVEIAEFNIGGLVHIKNLTDDYYFFEEDKFRLIGKHRKKIFKLGDQIPVKILNLDIENRRIDFIPAILKEKE
jgi:ribonuclease R